MNFGSNLKKGSIVINDSPQKIEGNFKKKNKKEKKISKEDNDDDNFIEIAKRSIQMQSKKKITNSKLKSSVKLKNGINDAQDTVAKKKNTKNEIVDPKEKTNKNIDKVSLEEIEKKIGKNSIPLVTKRKKSRTRKDKK